MWPTPDEERIVDNMLELLKVVRDHLAENGGKVVTCDLPARRMLGYITYHPDGPNIHWLTPGKKSHSELQKLAAESKDGAEKVRILKQSLLSTEGKKALLESIVVAANEKRGEAVAVAADRYKNE